MLPKSLPLSTPNALGCAGRAKGAPVVKSVYLTVKVAVVGALEGLPSLPNSQVLVLEPRHSGKCAVSPCSMCSL